jgi:iron complex transport system substrate-binding protein
MLFGDPAGLSHNLRARRLFRAVTCSRKLSCGIGSAQHETLMNRKTVFLCILFGLAMPLQACGPSRDGSFEADSPAAPPVSARSGLDPAQPDSTSSASTKTIAVTDALGRQLSFRQPPSRIVLPGRAVFITVDAIHMFPGASKRIIAMGRTDQGATNLVALIAPDSTAKAMLTEDSGPEQLAGLKPDLVILKSYLAHSLGSPIETLGIPVLYVDFETPEQYFRDLLTLGQVLGQRGRAAELSAYFREHVRRIQDRLAGLKEEQKHRVLLLYYSDREGSVAFQVPPASWMQTAMTGLAGGVPVWRKANPGRGWATVTLEQILAWDPDEMFVVSYWRDPSIAVGFLRSNPAWQQLRAMRSGKVYAFAGDFYSWDQPSPRWVLGLTWMAKKLYPERFKDIDIVAAAADFYHVAYGLDSSTFKTRIRKAFQGDLSRK